MTNSNNKSFFHEEDLKLCMDIATLLGWTNLTVTAGAILGRPPEGSPQSRDQARVPDWAHDFNDCCQLGIAFECYPSEAEIEHEYMWAAQLPRELSAQQAYRLAMLRSVHQQLVRDDAEHKARLIETKGSSHA